MSFIAIWLVLVFVGVWVVHTIEIAQRATVDRLFASRAESSAQFIGSYAQDIFSRNRALADVALQGDIPPATFNRIMAEGGIEASAVVDDTGHVLALYPSDPSLLGTDLGHKYGHLATALTGLPAASNVVLSAVRKVPVIAFATPFDSPTGRRVYSSGYAVDRTPLTSYLRSDLGQVPEAIYLVDEKGTVVTSGGSLVVQAPRLADASPALSAAAAQPGSSIATLADAPWRVVTVAVAGTPWRMVVAAPSSLLYGSISKVDLWTGRLVLLASALFGLVVLFLLEHLFRQRIRLAEHQIESAAILDGTADAFVGTDRAGRITAWNLAAERLFGLTTSQALGRRFGSLMSGRDHSGIARHGLSAIMLPDGSLPVVAVELIAQRSDGAEIPVELSISTTRLTNGVRICAFFRDIRARRSAEQQIKVLAQVVDSAGDAIYSRDLTGHIMSWNASAERLFGWTEAEMMGEGLDHPMVGIQRHQMESLTGAVVGTQTVRHVETSRFTRDGRRLELGLTLAPLFDESGTPVGVSAVARDIGERRRLEEQLRQSEGVFRSAFDDALLGMYITGRDGALIRVNSVFANMLGRPIESLVGHRLDDVTHPDYRGRSASLKEQALAATISGFRDEMCYLGLAGVPVWADISVSLVRDPFGAPLHFVTQVVDVTARRAALQERDSRDAMLAAVIANSQSLIYVKDLDGRYLLANEPFEKAFGVKEADLLDRYDNFLHPDVMPRRGTVSTGTPVGTQHVEQWSDLADGRHSYLTAKFPLHDAEGQLYAFCAVCLDVTEQRSAAVAAARARDEALAATAAKSAFLATMSHEIRTPMNAVIGMTGLLLDTHLDIQQREFVETVRISGEALLVVINDILDFSKIEAGQLELEQRQFILTEAVETAIDLVAVAAADKGLDLVCFVDESCPTALVGDQTRLRQVLVNLLSNAVKFTATGDVLLSVKQSGTGQDETHLTFTVTDTGIGIPPDRMHRLFRSFSQVDDSTTRVYGGTGLGLAISQRLVAAMGGELVAASTPGVGSTFTFSVAFVTRHDGQQVDGERSTSAELSPLSGKRVLIVDDNSTNRRILDLQLSRYSMSCTVVASPAAAVALVAEGAMFDVAVLDLHMPEMDGIELASQLGRLVGRASLPLVLLTSLTDPIDVDRRLVGAVLTKPVKSLALRAALVRVLESARPIALTPLVETPADLLPKARRLRLLLVEDNTVNQRVAQLMLGQLGHLVDTVGNGEEAVRAAHTAPYDGILMDVQMPVMDGLEATRRIRAEIDPAYQPYILAMTASALVEDRNACLAAGMDGYLSKPVRKSDLRSSMERILAN